MPDTYLNRVKMSVSGTPGTGTATLNAASTGYVAFASGDGGKTYSILWEDTGNAWEIATGCTYTHSGTSLTRGTRIASSTGSALSLTSAATATVIFEANIGNRLEQQALVQIAGADAATSMEAGNIYRVDVASLASDRTYTLPATAAVGDRVGVTVSSSSDTKAVILTAASGDTLNGVSGGTEWSRMFISGETVIMRCVVANSTWIVESDNRKREYFRVDSNGTTASHTRNAATKMSSELATETSDSFGIWNTTNKRFIPRRKGTYLLHGHLQMALIQDGQVVVAQLYKNGTTNIGGGASVFVSAAGRYPEADVIVIYDAVNTTDYIELFVYYEDATTNRSSEGVNTYFEGIRLGDAL